MLSINYTFLTKPTAEEIQIMQRWISEVATGVELSISYVIPRCCWEKREVP